MQHHEVNQIIETPSKSLPSNVEILSFPLLDTKVRADAQNIYIYGYLAITEKPDFILLKVTPIPLYVTNQSYGIMEISADVIAVEYNSQVYFQISDSELQNSIKIKEDRYLCAPSVVKNLETNKNCVIDEIYGRTEHNTCNVQEVALKSIVWKQLYRKNSWLYITEKVRKIALICNGEREDVSLNKTGIIQISQECIIRTKQNILSPRQMMNVRLVEGFTRHIPINFNTTWQGHRHHDVKKLGDEPIIGLSDEFGRLKDQEMDIQDKIREISWKHISTHPAIITSVSGFVVASLILISWVAVRLRRHWNHRRSRREAEVSLEPRVTPDPAPRSRSEQLLGRELQPLNIDDES